MIAKKGMKTMKSLKRGYGRGVISKADKGFYGHVNPLSSYKHVIKTNAHTNIYGSHKEA